MKLRMHLGPDHFFPGTVRLLINFAQNGHGRDVITVVEEALDVVLDVKHNHGRCCEENDFSRVDHLALVEGELLCHAIYMCVTSYV